MLIFSLNVFGVTLDQFSVDSIDGYIKNGGSQILNDDLWVDLDFIFYRHMAFFYSVEPLQYFSSIKSKLFT